MEWKIYKNCHNYAVTTYVVCIKRSIACSDGETSRGSKWLSRGDEYTPPSPNAIQVILKILV